MNAFARSVGTVPFLCLQATFLVGFLAVGMLAARTLRYGPAVELPNLRAPTLLPVHEPNSDYARAITARFMREYWSWSYSDYLRAKQRAAYLCDDATAELILNAAIAKASYYKTLLVTTRGEITAVTIDEQPGQPGHYLATVDLTILEWVSYVATKKTMRCRLQLQPCTDTRKEIPVMVTAFSIDTTGPEIVLTPEASQTENDALFSLVNGLASLDRLSGPVERKQALLNDEAIFFSSTVTPLPRDSLLAAPKSPSAPATFKD